VFAVAYPAYVREKARELRLGRELSIVEIAERLGLPKTTVYSWVRDLPLGRARRENPRAATTAMQRKFKAVRDSAYADGVRSFDTLAVDPTFRDFVCMYVGEGTKRDRKRVSLGNSDPRVVLLATRWLARFSRNPLRFELQYHADQDPAKLREFWGGALDVDPSSIALQRKSNSGRLRGRNWRSKHGVLTVRASDTLLRSRLQGWMDRLQEEWLHSPTSGA
jgi:hypothetical protein